MTARRPVPAGVIGMVHLPPLPGAPAWDGDLGAVTDRARKDAAALQEGGVDAILVENYSDAPFRRDRVEPVTVAAMTRAVLEVVRETDLPVGVNVLRNDARAALSIAAATGARFVRVNVHTGGMFTDQGWIEGQADRTIRFRERVAPGVSILADVFVKHAVPPPGLTLEDAARDCWHRGRADALIVSGNATGAPANMESIRAATAAVPEAPVLVGSGVTPDTVGRLLELAAGVIVGTALQEGGSGGPVDVDRVRRLVEAARQTPPSRSGADQG